MKQGEIRYADLGTNIGSEYNKKRPCLIVSPNDMNDPLQTVIVAPITSRERGWPYRKKINVDKLGSDEAVRGEVALDQLRTLDKKRLGEKEAVLPADDLEGVLDLLQEMFK
jgi:mRNA interferase MazF